MRSGYAVGFGVEYGGVWRVEERVQRGELWSEDRA